MSQQEQKMSAQPIADQMPVDLTDRIKAAIEAADNASVERIVLRARLARASRSGLAARIGR